MEAAKHGRLELAKLLVKSGAAIDETQRAGWSPLHVAVASKQTPMVNLLLSQGARIDATILDGKTLLDLAVEKGFVDEFRPL
ncbi:hypothetical protein PybrP1_002564 [[Pythium] brassicae (nom. inval.)]|nr:hypothetical protein PybrP1_002564 [[Pythium] brassicae (nom. inval.)]